jgi:uncharacterized protein YggE
MEKTQQAVSVLAICASILLAGMVIAYQPGIAEEFRFPTGVAAGVKTSGYTNVAATTSDVPKTLSLSGSGTVYVKANQATVILGVFSENDAASVAIEENAAAMTRVIAALKQLGFTDDDITTTSFGVSPVYNYEVYKVVGYQVTNLVQVKMTDLDMVGTAIDAATEAGANRVDSVSFGLSDATAEEMKLEAYTAAIADAKAKAKVITEGLEVSITGVQSITESYYYPYSAYRSYDVAYSAGEKSSTPIMEGNLSVSVTLNIVYLIE